MRNILTKVKILIKTYLLRDKFLLSAKKWFKDNGDSTLRVNYDLDDASIVFDVGGFEGDFAYEIYERYKSDVYIFEPISSFYKVIDERFRGNESIKRYRFGLSDESKKIDIFISDNASSVHAKSSIVENIELKSVVDFIDENNIAYINLIKINIEGGEFELLPALLNHKIINKIDNLQIQFHDFIIDADVKRDLIREQLSKTHELTYDYYFIWENWKLKS